MKNPDQKKITAMRTGGVALGRIKAQLRSAAKPGASFADIERNAQSLIAAAGMKPSFSTVRGYDWATCIMKNDGLCHGIPNDTLIEEGDIITIDVGLMNEGYHLDTTISFGVGEISGEKQQFLERGRSILKKAIAKARPGASVYEVSRVMEKNLQKYGYGAVYQLTGHGIGTELHMEPGIPCVAQKSDQRKKLTEGQTLAIEIMYTAGDPELILAQDGWTYQTKDGSLSAMFEETVLVTQADPEILTRSPKA